jgi:HAD superfamily hydrolase (TIGR01490 family)
MQEQPKRYAFFDVDETVVNMKTMRSFVKYYYEKKYHVTGKLRFKLFQLIKKCYQLMDISREYSNKHTFSLFNGCHPEYVKLLCKGWFRELDDRSDNIFVDATVREIRNHQANGVEIVFVSGSLEWCLKPLANKLGVKTVLSTKLCVNKGKCTGEIIQPQTIGGGKVQAIVDFLSAQACHEVSLEDSYAYGDHISDLPMLSSVGNPRVIKGNADLEAYAMQQNWPVLLNC